MKNNMTLSERIIYQQQLQTAFYLDLITLKEFLDRSVNLK
jgi:hypothetical protein